MRLRALYKLCKKSKWAMLLKTIGGRQWIVVDGSNMYPMDGLGELDADKLLTMMDVPENEKMDWEINESATNDRMERLIVDNCENDQPAEKAPMIITVSGEDYLPVYSPSGLVLIPVDALSPVADSKKTQTLFVRETESGGMLVVVKNGFELVAVIGRKVILDEKVWEALRDTADHIRNDIEKERLRE